MKLVNNYNNKVVVFKVNRGQRYEKKYETIIFNIKKVLIASYYCKKENLFYNSAWSCGKGFFFILFEVPGGFEPP